jgi:iron complex outermembrane receptor protein
LQVRGAHCFAPRAALCAAAPAWAFVAALAAHAGAAAQSEPGLFDLSIEELGDLRVTTVSRRAEAQREAAASVYVITAEDIRRSGVTTIPDALRLAPGVEVARNGSNEWTISIRGFSSDLSNKLLVLIDGRSVYSPLFAGVFWDVQDALLADIDRIEVVSGPGGTLWGSNAVNGVVNIVTKSASETQGTFTELVAGDEEELIAGLRHGWRIGDALAARVFVKHFERDAAQLESGASAVDGWRMGRAGFALEWQASERDRIDVRADAYTGDEDALVRGDFTVGTLPGPSAPGTIDVAGRSVLVNWRRSLSGDASFGVQFYYDYTDRQIPNTFNEARDTASLHWQHDVRGLGRHELSWGGELRTTQDDIGNSLFATFTPSSRTDDTVSLYLQDRIELRRDKLYFTVGTKLEDNNYTGSEYQPNLRLLWLPDERQSVWGAVSRAVRVPARLNTDLELFAPVGEMQALPFYVNVVGSDAYVSEEVIAHEAGYRLQLNDRLSFDLAVFSNDYDLLQTQEVTGFGPQPGPPPYIVLTAMLANGMEGDTYGGTFSVNWQPFAPWRLKLFYAHLQMDLVSKPGSNDAGALNVAGNSPQTQIGVRSYLELPGDFSLYTGARYVDELPTQNVPSYTAVDAGIEWQRPGRPMRVSVNVQNLNDARHREFGTTYIERSAYARATWAF